MGLALGTNLKFYTSLSKGLKPKVRKLWGLVLTFVDVTGEKLVWGFLKFLRHVLTSFHARLEIVCGCFNIT